MKKYGIKITLPSGDFLRSSHLLGDEWAGYRWYDSAEARDEAYAQMLRQPPYYRRDELPSQALSLVERDD